MESMLTVRLDENIKAAGTRIMKELGYTPSAAVRELFEYTIKNEKLPFETVQKPTESEIKRRIALFDQFHTKEPMNLSAHEIKEMRLKEKYGLNA